MSNPPTNARVPVSRAMRGPVGARRSAVIAVVIIAITFPFMSPAANMTAIGAAQLNAQSIPSSQPARNAISPSGTHA